MIPEPEIVPPVVEELPSVVSPVVVVPSTVPDEPLPPVAVEETTQCLADGADTTSDSADDWTVDEGNGKAETKEKVALGVEYTFPLDRDVKVTFTCLPKDESKRAKLSIERISTADITLPEGVVAATEYAYDITTDGMDNGDFKYDLSLPKSEVDGAEVRYIEQSADEVVASDVITELNEDSG